MRTKKKNLDLELRQGNEKKGILTNRIFFFFYSSEILKSFSGNSFIKICGGKRGQTVESEGILVPEFTPS